MRVDVGWADVYGAPLLTAFAIGAPTFIAGALLLGRALARTSPSLRWAGWGYAVALTLFVVSGLTVQVLQPVMGGLACVAAVAVALRLPAAVT